MNAEGRLFRSYREYLDLFENRLALLGHHDLLVFPDRAIGPSAEQALMDLRSNSRTSHHPWPSPAVYTTLRFAKSFAKALEIPAELSKTELTERWLKLWPNESLAAIVEKWPRMDTLLAHSTSSALWYQICQDAAKSDDPEITDWMASLIATMHWCLCCEEENLVGSRWHFLERVTTALPSLTRRDWMIITERNPWFIGDAPLTVHAPLLKAPFPAESRFFAQLEAASFLKMIYYRGEASPSPAPALADMATHDKSQRPDLLVITGKMRSLSYTLLESQLAQWTINLPSIPEAPFKHDIAHLKFLSISDLDAVIEPETHLKLRELYELILSNRNAVTSSDMLAAAEFAGQLSTNVAADGVHPNWSAHGVPCVSIDDTWALPRQKICLVSGESDYQDLWDPLSKAQRSKAPLPYGLQHLITTNHVTVASNADEALWAQSFFETRLNDFTKWEHASSMVNPFADHNPPIVEPLEDTKGPSLLSPSSIEALLRCPYQYFDQRIRRNQESAELDALTINALRRGEWLHKALEEFFENPNFSADTTNSLRRSLAAHVKKYFADITSPYYLSALERRIPKFAQDLSHYLEFFETPLQEIWPSRRHLQETSINANHTGLSLRGKIDRVDLLGNGQALLWDYKSGGNYNYGLKTLVGANHRKIQWLLYTKMAEQHLGVQIVGGGYVQLLSPKNSGIYFDADKLAPSTLEAIKQALAATEYSPKFLSGKDFFDADQELAVALEQTKSVIETQNFERRPLKNHLCQSCSSKVICGRPYFAIEPNDNSEASS